MVLYIVVLFKTFTEKKCKQILKNTEELYQWIKKEIDEKLRKYIALVRKDFSPKKIILFGSYAREDFTENSDIDVAVIVDKIEGDFLELEFQLFKLRRNIDDRIEPVLLEENNDKSGFLESILEYGKVIYKS